MSKSTLAGATSLLVAPLIVFVSIALVPTVSDDAAAQVTALTDHRGTVIVGLMLQTIAIVLLIGGVIWLSSAVFGQASRLALAGGILGVLGSLVVLFEIGIDAAAPAIVATLTPSQATDAIDAIGSSAAVTVLEPWTLLQAIGLALLAIAAVKVGSPRLAAGAMIAGAFVQVAGFATETRALILAGFAALFVGIVGVVRALVSRPSPGVTRSTVVA